MMLDNDIVEKISKKYGVSKNVVEETYNAFWRCNARIISNINFNHLEKNKHTEIKIPKIGYLKLRYKFRQYVENKGCKTSK